MVSAALPVLPKPTLYFQFIYFYFDIVLEIGITNPILDRKNDFVLL
jgi:hypothetical protein